MLFAYYKNVIVSLHFSGCVPWEWICKVRVANITRELIQCLHEVSFRWSSLPHITFLKASVFELEAVCIPLGFGLVYFSRPTGRFKAFKNVEAKLRGILQPDYFPTLCLHTSFLLGPVYKSSTFHLFCQTIQALNLEEQRDFTRPQKRNSSLPQGKNIARSDMRQFMRQSWV